MFALNSFTLRESMYSTTLAIFKEPAESLAKWKSNKISWSSGPNGKARLTFACRGSVDEPTSETPRDWIYLPGGR